MVSLDRISLHFGDLALFRDISLLINPKERIGLVGNNGAGKTTLLKILTGAVTPDEGKVTLPQDLTAGYLPQQMETEDTRTVYEETLSAYAGIIRLEEEIRHINSALAERKDFHSREYEKLIHRLGEVNEQFRIMGGVNMRENVEKILTGLGFTRDQFFLPTALLSGGWRMRIELAKILLKKPALLLLDEPTNHLDIESIHWLELFLKDYPGAIILVSHDKAFLDNITNRTVEISLGKIYDYRVSYSTFVRLRMERREQQLAAYRNQQKMIEDTERFIERFRYKNTKAVQVQSRIKQLHKLDRIEIDEEDHAAIRIQFPPAPRSGRVVVACEGLSKSYGTHPVLKNIGLVIERGEKIAFVGKNGEGKTTLARIIAGELDHSGKLKTGHNVKTGYFAQDQDRVMEEDLTVLETIDRVAVGDIRTRMRSILGAFLFQGDDVDKKVKVLSGGERSRLSLVKLLLAPHNLLILDEPTNHLDMRSKDLLKRALEEYNGTLILVSHDREFLDGLAEKVYEFRNWGVKEHIGGIYDFLKKKKMVTLKELERQHRGPDRPAEDSPSGNKKQYLSRKEMDRNLRRIRNRIAGSERDIGLLEEQIRELDRLMADPGKMADRADDPGLFNTYRDLQWELRKRMDEWEKLQMELEHITGTGD